jgi:hypothetical protein
MLLGCALLVTGNPALAADVYPSRPIRIVVAYTPAHESFKGNCGRAPK